MKVGTVRQIRRYPVKSMGGEILESANLGDKGIPGDRAWAVRDEVKGGIRGAKQIPALMGLSARYDQTPDTTGSSPAIISLPDGSAIETGDVKINEKLSAALNREVTLWPLMPADMLEHYRRGDPDHDDLRDELRAIFGRTEDEPLPDLSVFPPELIEHESPPGTYFDAFPLMLMTDATLQTMAEKVPDSVIDVRRFRPNLLVADAAVDGGMPELGWCGYRLRVGEALLRVTVECPRCVMVTHGFDDIPKDPSIMRALVREAGGKLGVYAKVEKAGTIRAGDAVELMEDGGYVNHKPGWFGRLVFTMRVILSMAKAKRRRKQRTAI